MSNFIWWSKIIHAFYNKIERAAPSEILGKRTIVLHGNRLAKRLHVDKSSKYAIKGKLTKILGSQTMKFGVVQYYFKKSVN